MKHIKNYNSLKENTELITVPAESNVIRVNIGQLGYITIERIGEDDTSVTAYNMNGGTVGGKYFHDDEFRKYNRQP